jgi:hypothetical protein
MFASLFTVCCFSPVIGTIVRETKMKQGKRNKQKRKESHSLVNCLFMTSYSREQLKLSLPWHLHLWKIHTVPECFLIRQRYLKISGLITKTSGLVRFM